MKLKKNYKDTEQESINRKKIKLIQKNIYFSKNISPIGLLELEETRPQIQTLVNNRSNKHSLCVGHHIMDP